MSAYDEMARQVEADADKDQTAAQVALDIRAALLSAARQCDRDAEMPHPVSATVRRAWTNNAARYRHLEKGIASGLIRVLTE